MIFRLTVSPPSCIGQLMTRALTLLCLASVLLPAQSASAQDGTQRVAGYTQTRLAVTNATIIATPDSDPLRANIMIEGGVIRAVGDFAIAPGTPTLDAQGLFVYAGFIDTANVQLVSDRPELKTPSARTVDFGRYALAATRPDNHKAITPEFQATDAFNAESDELEKLRAAGFCTAQIVPRGRIVSGQSALIALGTAPLRESLLKAQPYSCWRIFAVSGSSYPSTLMGGCAHLRQHLLDARHYSLAWKAYEEHQLQRPAIDPTLVQLGHILSGQQPVLLEVRTRDDVSRGLRICREFDIQPTLMTTTSDDPLVLEQLSQLSRPVILSPDFGQQPELKPNTATDKLIVKLEDPLRVQQDRRDRWQRQVESLAQLHQNGVRFACSTHSLDSPQALLDALRKAVSAGLPASAALAALTTVPAELAGQSDHLGTIEPGKLAHLTIFSQPFSDAETQLRQVVIGSERFEFNRPAPVDPDAAEESTDPVPDLSGVWQIQLAGTPATRGTLELQQRNRQLTGQLKTDAVDGRVASGTVSARKVNLELHIGLGEDSLKIKLEGQIQDRKLTGTISGPFGEGGRWEASRDSAPPNPDSSPPAKSSSPIVTLQSLETGPDLDDESKSPSESQPADSAIENDTAEQPTELVSDRIPQRVTGGNVLVTNATVMTGTGQTLTNTSILIRDGKFQQIGPDIAAPEGVHVIDAAGMYVIPGIIDTHSHIMITGGINESTQSIVPEVRVDDVVNSQDVAEFRAVAGGTTTARLLHGSANVIGGQDAVVKLRIGQPSEAHLFDGRQIGVKFALGENVKRRTDRFPNTRMGVEATLNRAFLEAIDYRRRLLQHARGDHQHLPPPRRDLRLEALSDIVEHQKFIHSHCYRADEILMLMRVASDLGIRVWSLQHVLEGYKIAPEIVAHGASCSTFSDWWAYKVEAYDATPYNAALLHEAGANVVIKSDDAELIRHMYLEAAKTMRYGGLDEHQALSTITLNSARELGIDDRLGSIEVGKDADLAFFNGHPFLNYSRCELTLIDGEIFFDRSQNPTAMSAAGQARSQSPPPLDQAARKRQPKPLRMTESRDGLYAIVGADLYPVDQPPIKQGVIVIQKGRIESIGKNAPIPDQATVIRANGLRVYPGMIDAGTTLGLTEVRRVEETNDHSESGSLQPDLRAGVAINPDSELFPVARAGGICTVLARPTGGLICGQNSILRLAGWTSEQMVIELEAGLQINWPSQPESDQLKRLTEFLELGREYLELVDASGKNESLKPVADPRLEALRPYLKRKKPVFIEANTRSQIAEALLYAEQQKLKIVITGGTDAWKLANQLRERKIPVIVGPVMRRPLKSFDPFDAPYANPGRLFEAGVKFCIRSNSASNSRNAPFEAGMAVAYGLPEEQAVRAVTLSAAEILGIDRQLGSLKPGKRATLVITDGSLLLESSRTMGVFIDGKPHSPTSKHTRMYERYRERLKESRQAAAQP